jgi:phosphoribosyl 1,2-cyclic phosphate phosphodiesterase
MPRVHAATSVTVLGSGTSHGVPMIGCDCLTCRSRDPRDRRTNASILVEAGGESILVDCGRDFRNQAIRERIRRVDHVLITHTHFDHVAGIDDLRVFNHLQGASIPLHGLPEHLGELREHTYHYLFDPSIQRGGGVAELELVPLEGPVVLGGMVFEPLPVLHGRLEILGYRFGDSAYISDASAVPEATVARLAGLDLLVIDALRFRPHSTHISIHEALALVDRLRPSRTYFTHICHDVLHEEVEEGLRDRLSGYWAPGEVHLAWDGLRLNAK